MERWIRKNKTSKEITKEPLSNVSNNTFNMYGIDSDCSIRTKENGSILAEEMDTHLSATVELAKRIVGEVKKRALCVMS